jgi:hypothetical protein
MRLAPIGIAIFDAFLLVAGGTSVYIQPELQKAFCEDLSRLSDTQ